MSAPLTPDEALEIARWYAPDQEWRTTKILGVLRAPSLNVQCEDDRIDLEDALCVSEIERALVERGLGDRYGEALCRAVLGEGPEEFGERAPICPDQFAHIAAIRTAPLAVIARAILETVREAQKEKP